MSYPKLSIQSSKYYRTAFAEETEFARVRRGLALRRAERSDSKSVTLRLVEVAPSLRKAA